MLRQVLRALPLLALLLPATAPVRAETFDRPLRKQTVDLGRSPYLPAIDKRHIQLTCAVYPHFMVKQVDDPGYKGALSVAVAPLRPGHTAACTQAHAPGEITLEPWEDYFAGAKRDLVFLYAADGLGEEYGFRIVDAHTGAKVFEDSISFSHRDLDFVHTSDTQMILRYLRVIALPCSVPKEGAACWSRFRTQAGLPLAPMPRCSGYRGIDPTDPSLVVYPVEVSLLPKPSIEAVAGPIQCVASQ